MEERKNKSISEILWGPREQLGRTLKRFFISIVLASLSALAVFFFSIVITVLLELVFSIKVNRGTMALLAVIFSFLDWIFIFFYMMILLYERYELHGQSIGLRERIAERWRETDKESGKEKTAKRVENEDMESISMLPGGRLMNFMIEMAEAFIVIFLSLSAGMVCAYVTMLSLIIFNSFLAIFDQLDLYMISLGLGTLVMGCVCCSAYKRRKMLLRYFIIGT